MRMTIHSVLVRESLLAPIEAGILSREKSQKQESMRRTILIVVVLYGSWIGMMLTHETGHVLHAWLSGASVTHVSVPMFGFSRTDVSDNPRPRFVAWGGPIWGCIIPLVTLTAAKMLTSRALRLASFFAGFCLVANGIYLAIGVWDRVGDAGDLLHSGAPRWTMIAFGVTATICGFLIWHSMGPRFGFKAATIAKISNTG